MTVSTSDVYYRLEQRIDPPIPPEELETVWPYRVREVLEGCFIENPGLKYFGQCRPLRFTHDGAIRTLLIAVPAMPRLQLRYGTAREIPRGVLLVHINHHDEDGDDDSWDEVHYAFAPAGPTPAEAELSLVTSNLRTWFLDQLSEAWPKLLEYWGIPGPSSVAEPEADRPAETIPGHQVTLTEVRAEIDRVQALRLAEELASFRETLNDAPMGTQTGRLSWYGSPTGAFPEDPPASIEAWHERRDRCTLAELLECPRGESSAAEYWRRLSIDSPRRRP